MAKKEKRFDEMTPEEFERVLAKAELEEEDDDEDPYLVSESTIEELQKSIFEETMGFFLDSVDEWLGEKYGISKEDASVEQLSECINFILNNMSEDDREYMELEVLSFFLNSDDNTDFLE